MRRGAGVAVMATVVVVVATLVGCARATSDYRHNRYDYGAFRGRVGGLPEPNYLPFVAHREPLPGGGEGLVLCRWPDAAFPLRVRITEPVVPTALQDEFNPRDPRVFVEAVARAFTAWEEAVGRPVRFRLVQDGVADVRVRFVLPGGDEAPELGAGQGVRVLGRLRHERERCRVTGLGRTRDRVSIEFEASEFELVLADDVGLLTPRQVLGVALHEIGHVLGASGQHSPLRGDALFEMADDSRVVGLSEHDRNTFRALYGLPPGSVYARVGEIWGEPAARARRTPPRLDEPVVDERFGFRVSLPMGWQRMRSPRGFVAVDGVSWDYDASIQVLAIRGRVAKLLENGPETLAGRRALIRHEQLELDGRPLTRLVVEGGGSLELLLLQDWGEDWVLLMIADSRARDFPLYQSWFELVLLSLEPITIP